MKKLPPHRYAAVLTLGCALLPGVGLLRAQDEGSNVTVLLGRARTLEQRGRLDLAKQDWAQVLTLDPNDAEALAGLVRAARAEGRSADAAKLLATLRSTHPDDPELARLGTGANGTESSQELAEAEQLANSGKEREAFAIYRRVYGVTPPTGAPALAYYQTEAATEEGRPQAIAGLRALSDRFPQDSRYAIALGKILLGGARTRSEGRTLLERFPGNPEAEAALRGAGGTTQVASVSSQASTEGAVKPLPKPSPAVPLQVASSARAGSDFVSPTLHRVSSNSQPRHQSFQAEEQAGFSALNQHRMADADQIFRSILARDATNPRALAGLGYLRVANGDLKGAVMLFEQAQENGDRSLALTRALVNAQYEYSLRQAQAARRQGDFTGAETQYKAVLRERSNDPEALEGLATVLLQAGRAEEAVPVYKHLTEVRPMSPAAWRGLVISQASAGQAAGALATDAKVPSEAKAPLQADASYLQALNTARGGAPTQQVARLEPPTPPSQPASSRPSTPSASPQPAPPSAPPSNATPAASAASAPGRTAAPKSTAPSISTASNASAPASAASAPPSTAVLHTPAPSTPPASTAPQAVAPQATPHVAAPAPAPAPSPVAAASVPPASVPPASAPSSAKTAAVASSAPSHAPQPPTSAPKPTLAPSATVASPEPPPSPAARPSPPPVAAPPSPVAVAKAPPAPAKPGPSRRGGRKSSAASNVTPATTNATALPVPVPPAPVAAPVNTGEVIAAERTAQAEAALRDGNSDRAVSLFRDAVADAPEHAEIWRGLVRALHAGGKDEQAVTLLAQVPDVPRAVLERDATFQLEVGGVLLAADRPNEALRSFVRAQDVFATQKLMPPLELVLRIATLLAARGDDGNLYRELMYLGDRPDLNDGQRRDVQMIWTNWAVRRGRALAAAGEQRRAVVILNAAAQAFAGNPQVIATVAEGYAGAGLPREAVALYKARDLSSAPAREIETAIAAGIAARDFRAADTWAKQGRQRFPKDSEMLTAAAELEQARGHQARAEALTQQAKTLAPAQNPAQVLTAELREAQAGIGARSSPAGQLSVLLAPSDAAFLSGQSQAGRPFLPAAAAAGGAVVQPTPVLSGYEASYRQPGSF